MHFIRNRNMLWKMGNRNRLRTMEQRQNSEQFRPCATTLAQQKVSWPAEAWKEEKLLLMEALLLSWRWQQYVSKAASTLINIFVVYCIWHKFVQVLTNLSQCGRVCRIWTRTKMFMTCNAHDPAVISFFEKHQRDLSRNIVIVWTYL
jgi:hypothetical protein